MSGDRWLVGDNTDQGQTPTKGKKMNRSLSK